MDRNENIKTYLGCAGWIVAAILLFKACDWYSSYQKEKSHEAYVEKKRNDSIREAFIADSLAKRKAFVADSLAHDPHYQDSVRKAEEEYKQWEEKLNAIISMELIGFIMDGDSVYHTAFHPVKRIGELPSGFTIPDIKKLRFITRKEEKEYKLAWCDECRNMDAQTLIDDGDYIHVDDIRDYVWDNQEEFEDIFK